MFQNRIYWTPNSHETSFFSLQLRSSYLKLGNNKKVIFENGLFGPIISC